MNDVVIAVHKGASLSLETVGAFGHLENKRAAADEFLKSF